jgi:hypothetical protein
MISLMGEWRGLGFLKVTEGTQHKGVSLGLKEVYLEKIYSHRLESRGHDFMIQWQ